MLSCYEGIWPSLKIWDFLNVLPKHQKQQPGRPVIFLYLKRQTLIEPTIISWESGLRAENQSSFPFLLLITLGCQRATRWTDHLILLLHGPAIWFLLNPAECSSWCLEHQLNCIRMTLNLKLTYFSRPIVHCSDSVNEWCNLHCRLNVLCPKCFQHQSLRLEDIATDFINWTSPI